MPRKMMWAAVASLVAMAVGLAPSALSAQSEATPLASHDAAAALAPSLSTAGLLAPAPAPADFLNASNETEIRIPQERNQAGMPLMIAGGVAFVAGAIAGGDAGEILMLGGAVVGAYGAYVYFGG